MQSTTLDSLNNQGEFTADQVGQILEMQRSVLEFVALGKDPQKTLDYLCKTAELLLPGSVASIMLFNAEKTALVVQAAPSIPQEAVDRLNGLVPGENAGTCGTAVYMNTPQYVCNTLTDKRWQNLTQFAKDYSMGACWSVPIRNEKNEAFGSFALSSFEMREPGGFHKHSIATAAILASIVLKRQAEQKQLEHAAHHDSLTGLPNRSFLRLRLEHAIDQAKRNNTIIALLFIDLDDFKVINDIRGHNVGDQVLQIIAKSMHACSRSSDTLARIGGDEFVLIVENFQDKQDIHLIVNKYLAAVACPIIVGGAEYSLSASMGISFFPGDGESATILIQNADTAMYAAKAAGRNTYVCYEQELTHKIQQRVELETELRASIKQNDFVVYYQPIFCSQKNTLQSMEALVRWQHPEKGLVPPDVFIPLAEETGLIKELGLQIIKMACQQCVYWWNDGLPRFTLAVNVSVNQLCDGFVDSLSNLLSDIDFPVTQLELEVTETLIMRPDSVATTEIEKMRELGVSISLDDFGTGQSSLSHLKNLPISKLKIDRSFVMEIPHNKNDMAIAKTIIAMGKSLGLTVVAEGVETEEQKQFLSSEGCDLLQGYYFSRPIPASEMYALLKTFQ